MSKIQETLSLLPNQPGVYLMKNSENKIIYVGKAASLKKRVPSYFRNNNKDAKTATLVQKINDVEFIVTDTEIEALLLENNLIKKHKPKFNISLKDDKRFPFICVILDEAYPRIIITRKVFGKKNKYFGPFTDVGAARSLVQSVNDLFKLKTCKKELPLKKNERPCLNYQIQRCKGACTDKILKEEYLISINDAMKFLEGDINQIINDLQTRMLNFSKSMEFEKAADLRDLIANISITRENQKVENISGGNFDYAGIKILGNEAIIVIFEFRNGILLARKISIFENTELVEPKEIMRRFILDHYEKNEIPQRIVVQYVVADSSIIEKYFTEKTGIKVRITLPRSPNDLAILEMISKNADMLAVEMESSKIKNDYSKAQNELQEILHLNNPPVEIVCFDISNLQGTNSVAAMSCFKNGKSDKSSYRRFKIRGYQSANDPGMIHEAVSRRLQHIVNENLSPPDIILIDGGISQLSRAIEAASSFGLSLKIISIAKRFEEIYFDPALPPLRLPDNSPALKILQQVRDEAHRFGVTYHRKLRSKELFSSEIADIPNIDVKRKNELLKHFKSIENIKSASIEELTQVSGIGKELAKKIFDYFHK